MSLALVHDERIRFRARASAAGTASGVDELPLDGTTWISRCITRSQLIHVPDSEKEPEQVPLGKEMARTLGYRSGLYVPLKLRG